MGGGRRKFPARQKFKPKEEVTGTEEKKEPPKPEEMKSLLDLWQTKKKEKPQETKEGSEKNL